MVRNFYSGIFMALLSVLAINVDAQTPVNGYARVTSIAGNVLTVANVNETYGTFEDGDSVIVMQMQDNVIGGNTTNTATFGDLSSIQSAGLYEVAIISTHTETALVPTMITLTSGLFNTYNTGANSRVQVITYPRMGTNYTVLPAGISAVPWNGNVGGVVAFWVSGTLTLNGNITADGAGFRGGLENTPNGYSGCDGTTYCSASTTRYAFKGEGIYCNTTAGFACARGKMLNGGGGGNDVNAGGGGGGNYSSGGNGGIGWTPAGTGCSPGVGGLGGASLAAHISGTRIFLGGGGGGGHENDNLGSAGANGGGIILLRANSIVTNGSCASRTISANGNSSVNASNDGSGGAGAGGTIVLQVNSYTVNGSCPLVISANGGNGGSSVTSGAHGGGGGGGQGAIIFSGAQPSSNVSAQTNAGTGGSSCSGCTASQNAAGGTGPNNSGILNNNSNPLPVELISFTAVQNGNQVDIAWETATEVNNDYFVVERMDVNMNVVEIGEKDGAGNTTLAQQYHLTDLMPNPGLNYYRLRQVDFNGTITYTSWIAAEFITAGQYVTVTPNPFNGSFSTVLTGYQQQTVVMSVTDITGRIVTQSEFTVDGPASTHAVSLEGEGAGIYFLSIVCGAERKVIRVVKY